MKRTESPADLHKCRSWLHGLLAVLSLAALLGLRSPHSAWPEAARRFGPSYRAAALGAQQQAGSAARAPHRAGRVPAAAGAVTITISAIGDCALGDLYGVERAPGSFARQLARVDEPSSYPFGRVAAVLHADDLTIANLEGTLTDARMPFNHVYAVRGKPANAAMLRDGGVEIVNLDNNHTDDFGPVGYADTKRALDRVGVGYFGRGSIDRRLIRGVQIVNLGYRGGAPDVRARMTREVARESATGALVMVSFHWGVEGYYATHPTQYALGRAAIDAGAALVVSHHPHVLQGIERYRGRYIAYSLGNFVFGANSQPADTDSIIYQQLFTIEAGRITSVRQHIVPVAISSTRSHNDFRPMLLAGAEGRRVLDKVQRLSAALLSPPTHDSRERPLVLR